MEAERMSVSMHRREILRLGATALAASALPLKAEKGDRRSRVVLRYRTRAESIAKLVPPPLTPADEPIVELELDWIEPAQADLLAPKPYGVARFFVAVKHGERQGRLPVGVYASNDRARLTEREGRGLPAKDAQIEVKFGEQSSITIRRREKTLFEMTAGFSDQRDKFEGSAPVFAPVFTLEPDWRKGVVRGPGAELWEVAAPASHSADPSLALLSAKLPEASPGDPLAELPVEAVLGAWRMEAPEASPEPKKIADLDGAALAAWAPLRFDRPVESERFWMPAGWREETTAYRLAEDEIARYQKRREILLDPIEVVEIDAMISQEAHEAMVPPVCRTAGRPMIKVLGLRVGASALSPVPFSEVWLFAFTLTANRMAWYAVSHIVGEGGDLTFGRDVFGYPSKQGDPEIVVTPVDFSLALSRMGREIVFADGPFHGFSTGTSLAQLPMVSLRAKPGGKGAELVYQMWTFQGRRNRVDPGGFQMGFPNAPAKGWELKPDPWYELTPAQPAMISVMENGVMQRGPGEVVGELPAFEEFYRERCDGVLPWEGTPSKPVQPTLLARHATGPSS
jgi:acetoacetate decarboxylase